jgi:hypothetical protein
VAGEDDGAGELYQRVKEFAARNDADRLIRLIRPDAV